MKKALARNPEQNLSRRERQIMGAVYRLGSASVVDIAAELPDAPTDTAIRTHLRILEEKGQIRRYRRGRKNMYRPAIPAKHAARGALMNVLRTFFGGSLGEAVAAHLADRDAQIDDAELERLSALIRRAQEKSQ